MSALVWSLEWRLALASRRDLALHVVAPLAVVFVIATGALPAEAAAAFYAALFVAFGLLRTALPTFHDGHRGITTRVLRAGLSPSRYLIQRAAADASVAFVELLPVASVAALFLHASSVELLAAMGALAVSLWIASLLGIVAAAASRSRGEVAVLCGVGLVLLLHASGVFSTPAPYGLAAALEAASPFRMLHEAFGTMVAGGGMSGGVAAGVWAIALPGLVHVLAPRLTASLER